MARRPCTLGLSVSSRESRKGGIFTTPPFHLRGSSTCRAAMKSSHDARPVSDVSLNSSRCDSVTRIAASLARTFSLVLFVLRLTRRFTPALGRSITFDCRLPLHRGPHIDFSGGAADREQRGAEQAGGEIAGMSASHNVTSSSLYFAFPVPAILLRVCGPSTRDSSVEIITRSRFWKKFKLPALQRRGHNRHSRTVCISMQIKWA